MALALKPSKVRVIAVEPLWEGASSCALHAEATFRSTLEQLELPAGSIPAVGLFDVLEHIENPYSLLSEVNRVLEPSGLFFVTVPSFSFLWSHQDVALGHFRRYSKGKLNEELTAAGFEVLSAKYIFTTLVFPAFLLRSVPY